MIATLLAAAGGSAACPREMTDYRMRGDPGVTARFYRVERTRNWTAGVALRVHVAATGRSFWFLPWQGGTDHRTNLAWVRERHSPIQYQGARRDLEIFAADASYAFNPDVPRAGDTAPAHLFLPDLTDLAWHASTSERRDTIARSFFDAASCAAPTDKISPSIDFPPVP